MKADLAKAFELALITGKYLAKYTNVADPDNFRNSKVYYIKLDDYHSMSMFGRTNQTVLHFNGVQQIFERHVFDRLVKKFEGENDFDPDETRLSNYLLEKFGNDVLTNKPEE